MPIAPRRTAVLLTLVVALVGVLALTVAAPGAGAAPSYPVVYNITSAAGVLQDPSAPPPGANDFSCKP
ncbi:MAG: lipase, partial [Actinobacteria bacterium]|nr:lipase [Actinomycetota bacterium]